MQISRNGPLVFSSQLTQIGHVSRRPIKTVESHVTSVIGKLDMMEMWGTTSTYSTIGEGFAQSPTPPSLTEHACAMSCMPCMWEMSGADIICGIKGNSACYWSLVFWYYHRRNACYGRSVSLCWYLKPYNCVTCGPLFHSVAQNAKSSRSGGH